MNSDKLDTTGGVVASHGYRLWIIIVATAALYYLLAAVTQSVFETTIVWPSSGVAIAALLLFGINVWPGIALGMFASGVHYFIELRVSPFTLTNLTIAVAACACATLASLAAYRLLAWGVALRTPFSDFSWVVQRLLPAALVAGVVAAVPGISASYLFGISWEQGWFHTMMMWIVSDCVAILMITPALYLAWQARSLRWTVRESLDVAATTSCLLVVSLFVFGPFHLWLPSPLSQASLLWMPLVWSAVRGPQLATAFLNLIVLFIVWTGTKAGYGPFVLSDVADSETAMQIFLGFTTVVLLLFQALMAEQRKSRRDLAQWNQVLEQRVEERTQELEQEIAERRTLEDKLRLLATTDSLTGALNRRAFIDIAQQEIKRARRYNIPLTVLMVDIDHFKHINDTYGHLIGDQVLIDLVRIAGEELRDNDVLGRFGGEEFAIIMPNTDQTVAVAGAERLRTTLAEFETLCNHEMIRFTVSIGVADLAAVDTDINAVLSRADGALYQAKRRGRNRLALASPVITMAG